LEIKKDTTKIKKIDFFKVSVSSSCRRKVLKIKRAGKSKK